MTENSARSWNGSLRPDGLASLLPGLAGRVVRAPGRLLGGWPDRAWPVVVSHGNRVKREWRLGTSAGPSRNGGFAIL